MQTTEQTDALHGAEPAETTTGRVTGWAAALAGVIAAAVALATAEVVSPLLGVALSPVLSIGNRVIDAAPPPLKDLAIDLFGTADKPVLIGGILLTVALVAAGIGLLAARRRMLGILGVGVLAAAGFVAGLTDVQIDFVGALVPNLLAFVAGSAALLWLLRDAQPKHAGDGADGADEVGVDRRGLLRTGGVLAVLAAGGAWFGSFLSARNSSAAAREEIALPAPAEPATDVPAGASPDVAGLDPYITPNAEFYRIDTALSPPQVDVESWSVRITGMVDNPIELTYADLQSRPLVEKLVTLACVSNEVGGELVDNARWLGVPLQELLDEAGVQDGASQVVGRSVDGFTAGFPTAVVDGRGAMVAIGMNGEPLPVEHGFPARLVVPGLYGYVSATKWLSEIELTTLEAFDAYWIPRGWAKEGPIKTQSKIDVPRTQATVDRGTVAVAGTAWAPTRGIQRVEVRVDQGRWQEAELAAPVTDDTWRQWVYRWDTTGVEPGSHTLFVRATDGTGETQTEEVAPPRPDGASGYHEIQVTVSDGQA